MNQIGFSYSMDLLNRYPCYDLEFVLVYRLWNTIPDIE